jgi:3-(3-hydroxy-phenyl)propionate hydroxylase
VIGADGSRSAVRHALDIPMEGSRSKHSYIVVDVTEDANNPLPCERVFHYNHPGVRRNVLFVPFVGGWRVDLQCRDSDNPDEFSGEEGVRRWLPKVMDAKYADRITWVSTYQFLQVVARAFTDAHARVLLVGEAAHLFSPFGARGMNSGIADATAAANAIELALRATDEATATAAIEEFAHTRRSAAEYNRAAAAQALAHVQKQTPIMWTRRRIAALFAPDWKQAGEWLDSGPYGPRSGPAGAATGKY